MKLKRYRLKTDKSVSIYLIVKEDVEIMAAEIEEVEKIANYAGEVEVKVEVKLK